MYGERIFCTDVYQAFGGSDGVSAQSHCLNNRMGITFHDWTIHKCSRISFITIADYITDLFRLTRYLWPFSSRRKSCSASSTKACICNRLNHCFRSHFKHSFFERLICSYRHCILNMLCINMTAVSQHQTGLLGIEWNFFLCLIYMTIIFIHQSCNRFSMKNRLFKNFFAVFQFYFQIQIVIRFNTNQRTHLTESMASAHLKSHMSDFFTDFDCYMIHIGS